MARQVSCPYCGAEMEFKGVKELQTGNVDLIIGGLGAPDTFKVIVYECPDCWKLEFFKYKKVKK